MSLHEKITECNRSLESNQAILRKLASAFFTTGNEQVGEQLSRIAEDLSEIKTDLIFAMLEESNKQYKNAQESQASLLNGIMAGAIVKPPVEKFQQGQGGMGDKKEPLTQMDSKVSV